MTDLKRVFNVLTKTFPKSIIKINGFMDWEEHYRSESRTGNHFKFTLHRIYLKVSRY